MDVLGFCDGKQGLLEGTGGSGHVKKGAGVLHEGAQGI